MSYIDETFYKDTFFGFTVPSLKFDYYSERASESLNEVINKDFLEGAEITDNVKKCTCAIMDLQYNFDNKQELSSESVGSYKRSFKDTTIQSSNNKKVYDIVLKYLSKTNLMYRGVADVY